MTFESLCKEPLDHLRALPFVDGIRFIQQESHGSDGTLEITTPKGRHQLSVVVKSSYLTCSLANSLIGERHGPRDDTGSKKSSGARGVLVLTHYLSPAVADQFVKAGICFADDPGNVHLTLGSEYSWTVLGKRKPPALPEAAGVTPANIELLFQFAIEPESAKWTVRDLAQASGISKTRVAQLRGQFIHEHLLVDGPDGLRFQITPEIRDRLISGYSQILRPKLILGRYRYSDAAGEQFVTRLIDTARTQNLRYSLTGGHAADALQRFYRSPEVQVFLNAVDLKTQRALQLLPDKTGPVVVLKAFGELVYWRETDAKMVAPPWLIYAELLTSSDPRAREAAEQLSQEFLQ